MRHSNRFHEETAYPTRFDSASSVTFGRRRFLPVRKRYLFSPLLLCRIRVETELRDRSVPGCRSICRQEREKTAIKRLQATTRNHLWRPGGVASAETVTKWIFGFAFTIWRKKTTKWKNIYIRASKLCNVIMRLSKGEYERERWCHNGLTRQKL